jgi:hypothetical protein
MSDEYIPIFTDKYSGDMILLSREFENDLSKIYHIKEYKDISEAPSTKYIEDEDNRYRFSGIEKDTNNLIFVNMSTGVILLISALTESTRNKIAIYEVTKDVSQLLMGAPDSWCKKLDWWLIRKIPFDKGMFKVGHPYRIRLKRCLEYVYAFLTEMTYDHMTFIYYDDKAQKSKEITITDKKYDKIQKGYWFQPVDNFDMWVDWDKDGVSPEKMKEFDKSEEEEIL